MIDFTRIKKQIISLLSANERSGSGVLQYSTNLGDEGYLSGEIDTAIIYAQLDIMRTICETDGHPSRSAFVSDTPVNHAEQLPHHYGSPGVPLIIPFDGAEYVLPGTRKSYEQIISYRNNENARGLGGIYGDFAHDVAMDGGGASKLAGFFAIVENTFYFTGFSATLPLADFEENDGQDISDAFEPAIVRLALGNLAKDGTISEKYAFYAEQGLRDLAGIRTGAISVPNLKPTVGTRDIGTK